MITETDRAVSVVEIVGAFRPSFFAVSDVMAQAYPASGYTVIASGLSYAEAQALRDLLNAGEQHE